MRHQLIVACLVSTAASAGLSWAQTEGPASTCPTVVQVHFEDKAQLAEVASWTEPWEVDHDLGVMVLGVGEEGLARLMTSGLSVEVDRKRTARACAPRQALPGQRAGIPGYPCYRTVEETFQTAQDLVAAHPSLATWIDIGDSWEKSQGLGGYDLMVLSLTNSAVPGTPTGDLPPHGKPRLFITSAIHAREYTTAPLVTRLAEYLLENHGVEADATWLIDEHELHLLLHTNPDGRKRAEAGAYWRKNTNDRYCSQDPDNIGADLNRNFPFQWGCCGGSSGYECDATYRGPHPASEPETQAVASYAMAIFPDQRGPDIGDPAADDATGLYIDIHSSGELVLWPWGFTTSPAPNAPQLQALGRRMAFLNGYYPRDAYGRYQTDGSTNDFSYGELGVASFVFELGTMFFQVCEYFESSILPGNLDALVYAAKVARTPYLTPSGPSVAGIGLSGGNVVAPGDLFTLSAVVDDTRFSIANGVEPTQVITTAEYTLDVPPWHDPPPAAVAMSASDGSFDSTTEAVEAGVDTAGLSQGRHTLFVRGRDASGAWGAVSAVFFWLLDPATAPRIRGTVRDAEDFTPLAATVTASVFSTTSDPGDGTYSLIVPEGVYDITASALGYASTTAAGVAATPGTVTAQHFVLPPFFDILVDDVESGNIGWTADPPWAITTEASSSPTHSWTDSPGGQYGADADVSLTSAALDLSSMTGLTFEFSHIWDMEDGYDFARVQYSTDGGSSWEEVASYTGTQTSSWSRELFDLPELDGAAEARIRFFLDVDWMIFADGWHVDDIVIRGAESVPPGLLFRDDFESGDTSGWSATMP